MIHRTKRIGQAIFNQKILYIIWFAHLLVMAFGLAHHEPWRDEADSWVIARDITMNDAWNYFRDSGHPPLWYAVLFPFARLGLPSETLQVIQWCIIASMSWLLLFRSPFPLWLKLGFLFSLPLTYQYGVVTRGYGLMSALLFAAATFYPQRLVRPWLYAAILMALLFIEVHVLGIVAALCLLLLWDLWCNNKRLSVIIAIFFTACGLLWLATMWQYDNANGFVSTRLNNPRNITAAIKNAFFPFEYYRHTYDLPRYIGRYIYTYHHHMTGFNAALLIVIISMMWRSHAQFVFLCGIAWLYYVFRYHYYSAHHAPILFVFTIVALWLFNYNPRSQQVNSTRKIVYGILGALSLWMVVMTVQLLKHDKTHTYSGAKDMAQFIQHKPEYHNLTIAYAGCHPIVSLSYYLPGRTFWQIGNRAFKTYVDWGNSYNRCETSPGAAFRYMRSYRFSEPVLVASHYSLDRYIGRIKGFTPLHHASGETESYWLYYYDPLAEEIKSVPETRTRTLYR